MVFEHIEKLKTEYTDKFVVVDADRPELQRFLGSTGTVRTVNMSGRALVEFDAFANIGWYDIDIDYLKVVDEPIAKEEKPKAKAAPVKKAAKEPSKLEKARAVPAAQSGDTALQAKLESARTPRGGDGGAPAAAKPATEMSMEEMLAAARGEKSGGPPAATAAKAKAATPAPAAPAAAKNPQAMSVEEMMAAARGEASGGGGAAPAAAEEPASGPSLTEQLEAARTPREGAAPPKAAAAAKNPQEMSVEEMMAAARGETSGAAAPAPAAAEEPPAAEEAAAEEPAAEETAAVDPGDLPTDVDGIVAYCRRVDAG